MSILQNKGLRVGLFIFISFFLFVAAILILGRKRNMFQQSVKISTVFRDVRGLKVGNNVRFAGIEVGAIVGITILSDTAVFVDLSMDKDVVPFIKKDSKASIGSDGLMGSKIIFILPGNPSSEPIEPGGQLKSVAPVEVDDIVKDIQLSGERIAQVANNLLEITDKVNGGDGVFGKLFTDTEFSDQIGQSGKNIAELSQNLNELLEGINNGNGLVGKLFTDEEFAVRIDTTTVNLAEISANLEHLTSMVESGNGIFGKLLTDSIAAESFSKAGTDLGTTIANLAEVSEKLNDENNALNRFIADPEFADSVEVMLNNLNRGIVEVTQASEALQRSGFVRAFSKDEEKKEEKKKKK